MSLELWIHARNARARAWAGWGLPITWTWRLDERKGTLVLLEMECADCGAGDFHQDIPARLPDLEGMVFEELLAAAALSDDGCAHARWLLHAREHGDPPEVLALTALELLAGA